MVEIPGHLARLGDPPATDLSAIPLRDLAAELFARVRRGESLEGHVDLLGALSMDLEVRTDVFDNRFARRRMSGLFAQGDRFLTSGDLVLEGATVVELGCGSLNPLALLLVHVLAGARQGVGIDQDPPQDVATAARGLARIATYMLADPRLLVGDFPITRAQVARNMEHFDLTRLWLGDPGGLDELRLGLRHESAERLSLGTGTVDYVCSTAFLEHVPDPAAVVAETARVTRRGGVGVHLIDGTDHWRYGDPTLHPLDFLRTATSAPLVHGSNRVRPLEFLPLFAAHGFEVVHWNATRTPLADGFQATLAEPFRSMPRETLEVGGACVYSAAAVTADASPRRRGQ